VGDGQIVLGIGVGRHQLDHLGQRLGSLTCVTSKLLPHHLRAKRVRGGAQEQSGAVGSSQEQWGAVRSSGEQWGAVRSSQEQSGAVGSSQEQSGAVRSSQEQWGAAPPPTPYTYTCMYVPLCLATCHGYS